MAGTARTRPGATGRPGPRAGPAPAEVRALVAAAGPWLDRLEAGLDTVLAPWAHPVSGGERQRLSVARAILAGRPVLLLDEATSHLDAATASAVQAVVLEHAADRSLLWVTHRQEELAFFPEVRSLDTVPG